MPQVNEGNQSARGQLQCCMMRCICSQAQQLERSSGAASSAGSATPTSNVEMETEAGFARGRLGEGVRVLV